MKLELSLNFKRKLFWFVFSLMGVIFFSKIKLHEIFGTPFKFSLLTIFGPNIEVFGGFLVSLVVFILGRLLQIWLGFSKGTSFLSYIIYLPLLFSSNYFAKLINYQSKDNDRPLYPLLIPVLSTTFFVLHPIGRVVWYYSTFWLIPIIIYLVSYRLDNLRWEPVRVYLYALAATYIDHAIGSVIFLYVLSIPAVYWNMAIPYVPLERAVFALGITVVYYFIRETTNSLSPIVLISVYQEAYPREEPIGRRVSNV